MLDKSDKNFVLRKLNLYVPSQNPSGLTTLNAILGQNTINVFEFTKQFNAITKEYLNDIVLIIEIIIFLDKKFDIKVKRPTASFMFFEQIHFKNKNIKETDMQNIIFQINLSDIYKIAVFIKSINNIELSLKSIFKSLLGTLKSMHLSIYNDVG
jgi:ribosomal protein L11